MIFRKKKKEIRDEEFFYDFLSGLTPIEMMNLTKALIRYMKAMGTLPPNVTNMFKESDNREIS